MHGRLPTFPKLNHLIPCLFRHYVGPMNEEYRQVPRRDVVFDVKQGLPNARKLWPHGRVYDDHNPLRPVAEAVVEHLKLCRIRFFRPPPGRGHGIPVMLNDEDGSRGETGE